MFGLGALCRADVLLLAGAVFLLSCSNSGGPKTGPHGGQLFKSTHAALDSMGVTRLEVRSELLNRDGGNQQELRIWGLDKEKAARFWGRVVFDLDAMGDLEIADYAENILPYYAAILPVAVFNEGESENESTNFPLETQLALLEALAEATPVGGSNRNHSKSVAATSTGTVDTRGILPQFLKAGGRSPFATKKDSGAAELVEESNNACAEAYATHLAAAKGLLDCFAAAGEQCDTSNEEGGTSLRGTPANTIAAALVCSVTKVDVCPPQAGTFLRTALNNPRCCSGLSNTCEFEHHKIDGKHHCSTELDEPTKYKGKRVSAGTWVIRPLRGAVKALEGCGFRYEVQVLEEDGTRHTLASREGQPGECPNAVGYYETQADAYRAAQSERVEIDIEKGKGKLKFFTMEPGCEDNEGSMEVTMALLSEPEDNGNACGDSSSSGNLGSPEQDTGTINEGGMQAGDSYMSNWNNDFEATSEGCPDGELRYPYEYTNCRPCLVAASGAVSVRCDDIRVNESFCVYPGTFDLPRENSTSTYDGDPPSRECEGDYCGDGQCSALEESQGFCPTDCGC